MALSLYGLKSLRFLEQLVDSFSLAKCNSCLYIPSYAREYREGKLSPAASTIFPCFVSRMDLK